ncbi:MAG TPA: hypothetical protein PLV92_05495, partial [Pirellulaceae bacterium]|nr:hypothetical protein [Pirellulaceae bacterium]
GDSADDSLWLRTDPTGRLEYSTDGAAYRNTVGATPIVLHDDAVVTVSLGAGADKLTVLAFDPNYAVDLRLYGNHGGNPLNSPDSSRDEIQFTGDIATHGGGIEAFADKITVSSDVTMSTLATDGDLSSGADLVFRARRVDSVALANLTPVGVSSKDVEIAIGAGAVLHASAIELMAQAEDLTLKQALGLTTLESQFFVQPGMEFLSNLTSLPAKVLVKSSSAKITIGAGAELKTEDLLRVNAVASANATGKSKSMLVSLGYAQASSTATIDILPGAVLEADGPLNVTSQADATAVMKTATIREESGVVGGGNSSQVAASVAVSNAKAVSHTTVADGATVHGSRTVNVRALGNIESEAESESGMFADGTAALSTGLQFSKADIVTTLAGTVTADMATPGGEVVKFEFNPTTTDPEEVGYIDYAHDRILVYDAGNDAANWIARTGDSVDYSPRRGNSIGGMTPGVYYVIKLQDDPATSDVDESHYVQLARTELNALDGVAIDLKAPDETLIDVSLNTRTFDSPDISDDSITLSGIGNTFELGQSVYYYEPGHLQDTLEENDAGETVWKSANPAVNGTLYVPLIPGLEHGAMYWVMTGRDEFNLIGDRRDVSSQTLQLGTLENETRGGIARVKLSGAPAGATGFTLKAAQVIDTLYLTFGGVSELDSTDKAVATSGITSEDQSEPESDGGFSWNKSIFDSVFAGATKSYSDHKAAGGADSKSALQVGGALAFSFTDHHTETLITGTADLNSNDDMELTSNVIEHLTINAESSTEEQKDAQGNSTGTAAANSLSAAIVVGVAKNDARVVVEGKSDTDPTVTGATLDSMRAMRLLAGVTYPYLTRPDEFVPTSAGELSDKIEKEGVDAVNTYLDGTLGLKSGLLNTWARSTTSADKVGIAGSINVLTFDNTALSIVETGAQLNQDPFYHPDPRFYLEPGDPGYDPDYAPENDNDNVTHSNNANNVDEHVVSIEATNYMQFLNVTGVFGFSLPSLSIEETGFVATEAFDASIGAGGKKGGVGGAFFLEFIDNTTKAIVEPGVDLYSGKNSGVNIKAEEAIMGFGFTQGGADAGKFGIGGSFSYVEQDSDILAQLSEGTQVTGGRVDVNAGSLETAINWAGGVAKSKSIGAGLAVAINNTDRKTRAVIGEESDSSGLELGHTRGSIDVEGVVAARAYVDGDIYAFAVAGAYANTAPDKPDPTGGGLGPANGDAMSDISTSKLIDGSIPGSSGQPGAEATQKKAGTGVGIAGAASINNVTDHTQASLSDMNVASDFILVRAVNRNQIVAATGSLAFSKTDAGGSAAGLAGAFSYNEIEAPTDAFVRDADIALTDVGVHEVAVELADRRFTVQADNVSNIWTLSAGMAGAVAAGTSEPSVPGGGGGGAGGGGSSSFAGSLAGSVSLNTITGDTSARVLDTTVDFAFSGEASEPVERAMLVTSSADSDIFAIAGGLSLSVAKGDQSSSTAVSAGVAIAVNKIDRDLEAAVDGADLSWAAGDGGSLTVGAKASGTIKAFTLAGALSAALSSQQGSGIAGTGAASGSVNRILGDVTAKIVSSNVDVAGDVAVTTEDTAKIVAAAGGVALAFSSSSQGNGGAGAFGAGFA